MPGCRVIPRNRRRGIAEHRAKRDGLSKPERGLQNNQTLFERVTNPRVESRSFEKHSLRAGYDALDDASELRRTHKYDPTIAAT